jgi:hypothetical protein
MNCIFWFFAPCGWVISSRLFEGMYRRHPQGYESVHGLTTLKMETAGFFETPRRNYPTTRRINPEYLSLKYDNRLKLLKSFIAVSFSVGKAATFQLH